MTTPALPLALAAVPLVVGLVGSRLGARVARDLAAASATMILTGFAVTASLATGAVLVLTTFLGVVERCPWTHPDDWSARTLREMLPVPVPLALIAGGLLAAMTTRAVRHLVRTLASARRTAAVVASLPAVGGLAVIDDDASHAYSVPGRRGRVVLSTGLLRSLTAPQRRALLAHEEAHLRHHHHRYAQLTRLAAAANPLLAPVTRAVDLAIERWADAAAVRAVGDPTTVAHALGTAALAGPPAPPHGLGAAHHDVVDRVRDLLEPTRRRRRHGVLVAIAVMLCWASVTALTLHTFTVVEFCETVAS